MTFDELRKRINTIAKECDKSRDQQIIKAILLSAQGAMLSGRHEALMKHVCDFSERELIGLRAKMN